jgi:ribose transport system substrate-binding protein
MGTRRLAAGLLGVLALTATAAACGDDDDEGGDAEEPAATTADGGDASEAAATTSADAETAETTAAGGGEGITIGFVSIWCSNPTVCAVNQAFAAEAEAQGASAVVLEADINDMVNSQVEAFDQLIAQGVDAIAFWPLDDVALQAPMERAREAGIELFAHDLYNDPSGSVVTSVLQGREAKAKMAASLVCESLGDDGGQVLYGTAAGGIPTLVFLQEKFEEYLADCPGAEVVATFENPSDDVDGAQAAAEAALQANPDVEAVFNYNDPTGIGVSNAANALGRELAYNDGYNLSQDGLDALGSGRLTVSWDYRAADIGQVLARTMVEYLDGTNTSPPKFIAVWPLAYTPATVGEVATLDERLAKIRDGVYIVDEQPEFMTMSDEFPAPPDLPLPDLG